MSAKSLPSQITSYDLLKTFAIITMIIDHLGYFFFPDLIWFRVIGRLSFPVWLFLVGYARSRDIPPKMIIGAGILIAVDAALGAHIIPLNILVTIAVVRLGIDAIMRFVQNSPVRLWTTAGILFVLVLPGMFVFEYGTQAFIMAMAGYMVRNKERMCYRHAFMAFGIFEFFSYVYFQNMIFELSPLPLLGLVILSLLTRLIIYRFRPCTFPVLSEKLEGRGKSIIHICGRRTLEIYVLHFALFQLIDFFFFGNASS